MKIPNTYTLSLWGSLRLPRPANEFIFFRSVYKHILAAAGQNAGAFHGTFLPYFTIPRLVPGSIPPWHSSVVCPPGSQVLFWSIFFSISVKFNDFGSTKEDHQLVVENILPIVRLDHLLKQGYRKTIETITQIMFWIMCLIMFDAVFPLHTTIFMRSREVSIWKSPSILTMFEGRMPPWART